MANYVPPLSVYFVWHPADTPELQQHIDYCATMLQRDVLRPFTRPMNIPVFFRTSHSKQPPSAIVAHSKHVLVFAFVGMEIAADRSWSAYIQNIAKNRQIRIIPIAIDKNAYSLNSVLGGINFVRLSDSPPTDRSHLLFINIAHEVYRFALNSTFTSKIHGKDTAIKLFLSHSKSDRWAVDLAKQLKAAIDNSSMRNFFDASDIAPAFAFSADIEGHLKESTVIAIHSDSYSSRYWCQREIMTAKAHKRPIIAVDCLNDFEDRRFTYSANFPAIHVGTDIPVSSHALLRILSCALLETVRHNYGLVLLKSYRECGWFGRKALLLPKPPEPIDILGLLKKKGNTFTTTSPTIIYPEPSVYMEEHEEIRRLGLRADTPLTCDAVTMKGKTIGVSISEPSTEELTLIGQGSRHLLQLSQDISRHILAREGKLVYGGDLRDDGFTRNLFEEALVLQNRLTTKAIHVENYIAWPIYLKDSKETKKWKSKYRDVAKMVEVTPPRDIKKEIPSLNTFLAPSTTENRYVWGRSLTEMRNKMIGKCNARICAGGKLCGYSGFMPGVLEEILIAIRKDKPLYLLGAFGGVTGEVCDFLDGQKGTGKLVHDWQIQHTTGYKGLLDYADKRNRRFVPDYSQITAELKKYGIRNLSKSNGLSVPDNRRLFSTPFVDEAVHLLLKGLRKILR